MNYIDIVNTLYSSLILKYKIIGIKLIKSKEEYEKINFKEPIKALNYCAMVRMAAIGSCYKAKEDNFKCKSAPRVLGINPDDTLNNKGQRWASWGLYKDEKMALDVRLKLNYFKEKNYGVTIAPIEKYENAPDVIIFICNPYNAMRIFQGYTYSYGICDNLEVIGNQAICYESTTRILQNKNISISFLCIGTRHKAGWSDDDMSIGINKKCLEGIASGILNTINPMEHDKKKKIIKEKLNLNNINYKIEYSCNYYKKA